MTITIDDRHSKFKRWMGQVDTELLRSVGLTHRDIADQTWHDWFDSEYTPAEAATEALENEGLTFPTEGQFF